MSERKAFPLSWPDGWKRTKARTHAQFGKKEFGVSGMKRLSVADSVRRVLGELQRMGVHDWEIIISTNVPLRLDGLPLVESRFRALVKVHHPDVNPGDKDAEEKFMRISRARDAARLELSA